MQDLVFSSPVGNLRVTCQDNQLAGVHLNSEGLLCRPSTDLQQNILNQFESYFASFNFGFSLPILQEGSEHQKKVWAYLASIPTGKVRTYGEVAKAIGSSAQAVGNACRHNPLPIVVPCHRVVAASDIGGFSGATDGELLNIKRFLLKHEGLAY